MRTVIRFARNTRNVPETRKEREYTELFGKKILVARADVLSSAINLYLLLTQYYVLLLFDSTRPGRLNVYRKTEKGRQSLLSTSDMPFARV